MYGYDVFHEEILTELIKTVRENSNRHAYLFVGPQGVGRLKAAKLFSATLSCTNSSQTPCGSCPACIGAKNDTNPDIIYVRPTDKKTITAQQARDLVQDAYIKPFESARKIYIIEDASLLNEFAQNCLLKILEEPPEYIVFIIIASSESQLLQTVLSRCVLINFPSVDKERLFEYIKTNHPDEIENSELLNSLCQGVIGELEKILSDPDYFSLREESFKMLSPLLSKHKITAYSITSFLEEHKEKTEQIFDFWISFLRDIMMLKNKNSKNIINQDMQEDIRKLSQSIDDNFPIIALEQLFVAKTMLRKYVNLHNLSLNLSFSIKKRLYQK